MNKLISYCFFLPKFIDNDRAMWDDLYDDYDRYWYNLPALLILDKLFYPDYKKRFYVTKEVMKHPLSQILTSCQDTHNIEIEVLRGQHKERTLICERFRPFWEDWDIVLLRDIDSVPTIKEWQCNKEFEKYPDRYVYTCRSHPNHFDVGCCMLGGLCGFRPKEIKEITGEDIHSFVTRYSPVKTKVMDQTILINAFTKNSDFTGSRFLDLPIHLQHNTQHFPCLSINDANSPMNEDQSTAMAILQEHIGDRWAGQPVDVRGAATRGLLELDPDISALISSSKDFKELYL